MQPPGKSHYYLKAAAVGGVAAGLLSVAPFIGACNLICCLWIVGGAVLAVHLTRV